MCLCVRSCMDWIDVAREERWWALLNVLMNLWVP